MRRLLVPLAALMLSVGLATWQGRMHGDASAAKAEIPQPKTLGVATCASAACHHGNGDLGSQGSEYSTFIAVDPHARAYETLSNNDSKRIQANLGVGGGKANENPLCLKCHGLGESVPKHFHADGVGCEQCHGPAEKWKATHYLNDFRKTPLPAGFHDLREDLTVRAGTCMKCHVGDGTREVNHDLIAAGHPRLKFEFGAYYANYARDFSHWRRREKEELAKQPDRQARHWLVGQAVSAGAALELLADRAGRKDAPWPEFAEYDCTACHHGLKADNERQRRFAVRNTARVARGMAGLKPGQPAWASWYTGELPVVLVRAPGKVRGRIKDLLGEIDGEMARPRPDREKVRAKASLAAGLLRQLAVAEAVAPKLGEREVLGLLSGIAGNTGLAEEGWDGVAQTYLGLAALTHTLGDLGADGTDEMKERLKGMRRELRDSFPPKARPLYDSPTAYAPAGLVKQLKAFGKLIK